MTPISVAGSKPRAGRWRKALLWLVAILAVLAIALVVALNWLTYEPEQAALQYIGSSEQVAVTNTKHWISFEPAGQAQTENIIFYPGGLVEPESYAPFLFSLAEQGYRAFLVKMPLQLAVFAQNRASEIIELAPNQSYVIGGHSLGGSMAARFTASHPDAIDGIFFLASYADDKANLSASGLQALQITGTQDNVLNREVWENSRGHLPEDAVYLEIEGGNHAQFGMYGPQRGDGEPAIGGDEQLRQTVEGIVGWLQGFPRS
ncbi:alpha/beta hydrolase [Paenibacillus daejeonensis]|uniref:alpha/beta hydrolase n=1 Tax=Paenibacillus daejeonensis TaxID=135193 RepID=UPI00037FB10B|nr:alpha/beta hydrolase [Paenibacillus daejeonensis]